MSSASRIDLTELKNRIFKTLGPNKARRYFVYLHRLLSHKLSKVEFDKLCCLTIGHENLPLHNQFIQSVLENAHSGKVAPPPPVSDITASICTVSEKTSPHEDGYLKSPPPNATSSVVLSSGDILLPHNERSAKCDRGIIDRPSLLGPNGRIETVTHREATSKGDIVRNIVDNGNAYKYDFKRSICQHQGVAEQLDNERSARSGIKKRCLKKSPPDHLYENSNGLAEVATGAGEETCPFVPGSSQSGRPIHAPLGVPVFPASKGGAYKSSNSRDFPEVSYMNSADIGELSDTETLRKRMEHIADMEGIDGVPVDCANLLNNALDAYLKKLIKSCLEIARSRSKREQIKLPYGNVAQGINRLWQNHLMHGQPNSRYLQELPEVNTGILISPLDFTVAMELNPPQLGEDWPLVLEKITSRSINRE